LGAPTCKRCGQPHFNFQSCAEGAAAAAQAARQPVRFMRPREGERDFGNRFSTRTGRDHGNTIVSFIPRDQHPMYLKPEPPKEAA